jgi:hypothetical protein
VYVNLWELITAVAGKDLSNNEKCQAIQAVRAPRFGSELSLEINPMTGVWTVSVFSHEDSNQKVSVAINPDGFLTVTRSREMNGLQETRAVLF